MGQASRYRAHIKHFSILEKRATRNIDNDEQLDWTDFE